MVSSSCASQILGARSRGLRFQSVFIVKATQHWVWAHIESDGNDSPVESWAQRQVNRRRRNPWFDRHHVREPMAVRIVDKGLLLPVDVF